MRNSRRRAVRNRAAEGLRCRESRRGPALHQPRLEKLLRNFFRLRRLSCSLVPLFPVPCSFSSFNHPGAEWHLETQSTDSVDPVPRRGRALRRQVAIFPSQWELEKQRILVPGSGPPRRIADRQTDIHAQHDAKKQLHALQPAGNMMMRVQCGLGLGCGARNRFRGRPRQRSREYR